MPIGENVMLKDKVIRKTDNIDNVNNIKIKRKLNKVNATDNAVRVTFYLKAELAEKIYNFAYWDRHSVTEAFNIVITDGLKGKVTKSKPQ